MLVIVAADALGLAPLADDPPVAQAAPTERFIATPGPLGPVTVIGDSVLLGSLLVSPTIADTLAAQG